MLLLGRCAVLVCVVASVVLAGRFGWTRGAGDVDRWIYASAAVALDLFKSCAPVLAVVAWNARRVPQAIAAWVAFVWLTGFSLLCASGLTATQLAEKLSVKNAVTTVYQSGKAELDRLVQQRSQLPQLAPADEAAESAAQAAVAQVDASVQAECATRASRCRELEARARETHAALAKVIAAVATTRAATALDQRIDAARLALERVDLQSVHRHADPQAADIAHLTGIGPETVTALLHLILAVSIEIGSGVGVWLAFGHRHGPALMPRVDGDRVEAASALTLPAEPVIEAPAELLVRFCQQALRPMKGARVAASELLAQYEQWCEREGVDPLTPTIFGRRMGELLAKGRKGGRIWYLEVALTPRLQGGVHNARHHVLGTMARVGRG